MDRPVDERYGPVLASHQPASDGEHLRVVLAVSDAMAEQDQGLAGATVDAGVPVPSP